MYMIAFKRGQPRIHFRTKFKRTKNVKEGVKSYTRQSALLRVLLKNHNISTYEKDSSSASLWGLEEDLG